MKILPPLVILTACSGTACLNRPVIYTGTQLGVHAQGIKSNVPEKITVAYDRSEYAWVPRGNQSSIKAGFDAEYRGLAGLAVSDLLATGGAAGGNGNAAPMENQSLIVSTTTKFNLGLDAGAGTDGAAPSFNAGLKRSVFALFPAARDGLEEGDLPSTYTDLSVHASGLTSKIPKPKGIDEKRHLTTGNGVRVVQTVATGEAANRLGDTGEGGEAGKKVNRLIRAGLGLKPDESGTPSGAAASPENTPP